MSHEEREKRTLNKRIEEFIQKGKAKYGENTYNYSQVWRDYKNNHTPVKIKCTICNGKPFLVIPFMHTSKGNNQKGTCRNCYESNLNVQATRWDPNLVQRISEFKRVIEKKYGEGYSYPNLEKEYKNEESDITVVCHNCSTKPYQRKARSLKSKSRYGGCKVCRKKAIARIIAKKNKKKQERNQQTKNDPKPYGCIYKITNTKNKKIYIGYTTWSAEQRLKSHSDEAKKLAKGNKKAKSYLHSSMNYHGLEHFEVGVLEEFTNITPIQLGTLEKEYITRMKPHYNISPGGELGHYKTDIKNKINKKGNLK